MEELVTYGSGQILDFARSSGTGVKYATAVTESSTSDFMTER